jgi:hypothetical protein
MNSLEKYEEIVHEWGSWEKYMESLCFHNNAVIHKPTQNISNMENRIQINGVWYVREDSQPTEETFEDIQPIEETFEDIQVAQALECGYETGDYCWTASRMYKDDGETFYPGIDIKFTDKTSGNRETWVEDYWDNETWILGVYCNDPESMVEAKEAMNEKGIKDFRNFIHKLIQMGWLENK